MADSTTVGATSFQHGARILLEILAVIGLFGIVYVLTQLADGDDQLVPLADGNSAALASNAALSFTMARGQRIGILSFKPRRPPGLFSCVAQTRHFDFIGTKSGGRRGGLSASGTLQAGHGAPAPQVQPLTPRLIGVVLADPADVLAASASRHDANPKLCESPPSLTQVSARDRLSFRDASATVPFRSRDAPDTRDAKSGQRHDRREPRHSHSFDRGWACADGPHASTQGLSAWATPKVAPNDLPLPGGDDSTRGMCCDTLRL